MTPTSENKSKAFKKFNISESDVVNEVTVPVDNNAIRRAVDDFAGRINAMVQFRPDLPQFAVHVYHPASEPTFDMYVCLKQKTHRPAAAQETNKRTVGTESPP